MIVLFAAATAPAPQAHASTAGDYPPPSAAVGVEPIAPLVGTEFSATFAVCLEGEDVHVIFEGRTTSTICGSEGTATVSLVAPTEPGEYVGFANSGTSDREATFVVVVVPNRLPATGSASTTNLAASGAVLLAAGVGLLVSARDRRLRIR